MIPIKIKKIDPRAYTPVYSTEGSAGFDFYCIMDTLVPADTWRMIMTGISLEIHEGYELQIRSRSGAAIDHGLIVLNQPGTVDSDYRGPIGIVIWNITNVLVTIEAGTRIAQGIISPVVRGEFIEVQELSKTERDQGGFGSTG